MRIRCEFCGTDVDPDAARVFRYGCGWFENRSAGGTNAVALPTRQERWACWSCIDRQRKGLNVEQGSLL